MSVEAYIEETAGFYAVIPTYVLDDKRLTAAAKLLYATISALTKKHGFCFASNAYLAKREKATTRSIQLWLAELKDAGHIETELNDEGNARKIWLTLTKKFSPPRKK
jgi:CRISPR/Cas system-associated endonuclease Cas1